MPIPYIVVDLDSTLADNSHRGHLALSKQWDAFHDAMDNDAVYEDVDILLNSLFNSMEQIDIVFLTAREEKYREKTLDWLEHNEIAYDGTLIMRDRPHHTLIMRDRPHHEEKAGDFKLRKLKEIEVARDAKPLFCLEDQMNITRQLRAEGFIVWNVRNSHA